MIDGPNTDGAASLQSCRPSWLLMFEWKNDFAPMVGATASENAGALSARFSFNYLENNKEQTGLSLETERCCGHDGGAIALPGSCPAA